MIDKIIQSAGISKGMATIIKEKFLRNNKDYVSQCYLSMLGGEKPQAIIKRATNINI